MKYTNKMNLPEALYRSLSQDYYKKEGNFTASELPTPAQIWALRKRYGNEIVVDVADLIYPLIGSNTHYILERAGVKNALTEERLFATVGLWTISGKLDFYFSDKTLWDYKVTTMWVLKDGVKPEWEAQANINSFLLQESNFGVENIKICCLFRDWSKVQALSNPNYLTKKQVAVLDVELWSLNYTYDYIADRISTFVGCEQLPDDELPECTPEERWEKPTKWAVMKGKNKRATKLFEVERDALEMAGEDEKYHVVKRPGQSTRCEYYCELKNFCSQYKKDKEAS